MDDKILSLSTGNIEQNKNRFFIEGDPAAVLMMELCHDDPEITETDKLRYDACLVVNRDVAPEGEVGVKTAGGGKYAVFVHKGPYRDLNKSYSDIFRNWIPKSKFELADSPHIEIYLNDADKVKEEELLTEICIPLK